MRIIKYYKQVKSQAQLLLHFVNDMLDHKLIKHEELEGNLVRFNPKTAVLNIIDIFIEQARM